MERGRYKERRETESVERTVEKKFQDPGRAMERALDKAAVTGLGRVKVGDPATCSRRYKSQMKSLLHEMIPDPTTDCSLFC